MDMPALEARYRQEGDEGVQVVAVNLQKASQVTP
jgi:hypothetical protein